MGKKQNEQTITIYLKKNLKKNLTDFCKKERIYRNRWIEQQISIGLEKELKKKYDYLRDKFLEEEK